MLVFSTAGAYISSSSLTTDATQTNEPIQLGYTNPSTGKQVQYVIARSIVPANPSYPTHIRYLLPGNGRAGYGPAEYFTYNTVTTGGHAMSPSCNGCAAYSVFRPSLPETFTSPGPVTIYYDKNDNRLATPEVRLQPRIALADGANVTANLSTLAGFASDNGSDPDATEGQFFGTSAAGPHAAAIAALVLQAHGGRHSMTPAQMTSLLERSTFTHDLDPNYSSGSAKVSTGGKVTISISSDGSAGSATIGTGLGDPHSFAINYVGGSNVTSIVFNPGGTAATAGERERRQQRGDVHPARSDDDGQHGHVLREQPAGRGLHADYERRSRWAAHHRHGRPVRHSGSRYTNAVRHGCQPVLHDDPDARRARSRAAASCTSRWAAAQCARQHHRQRLQRGHQCHRFRLGVVLRRHLRRRCDPPERGGDVTAGMTFSGTTADGGTFSGVIKNNLGSGWATQDGYGFVNAQTAVSQTVQ